MNKNESKPISIMNKTGITLSELRKSLILLDTKEIEVVGCKYTIHYQDLHGDVRLYLCQDGTPDPIKDSFVSSVEIEKFADCFPYSNPETVEELEIIYYCSPLLGTLRTADLLPGFNADYLFMMYGLINMIPVIREDRNSTRI